MSVVKLVTLPQVTVATAGTEQRIAASSVENVVAVYLSVPAANNGVIIAGDSSVAATVGRIIEKSTTFEIVAPQGHYIDIYNIWVDAATSGDKVNVSYLKMV
jgi:hypothetical protein